MISSAMLERCYVWKKMLLSFNPTHQTKHMEKTGDGCHMWKTISTNQKFLQLPQCCRALGNLPESFLFSFGKMANFSYFPTAPCFIKLLMTVFSVSWLGFCASLVTKTFIQLILCNLCKLWLEPQDKNL